MLEKDFSIEKLIKNLRDLKLLIKSQVMTQELRLNIQYQPRNLIDLDISSDEFSYKLSSKAKVDHQVTIHSKLERDLSQTFQHLRSGVNDSSLSRSEDVEFIQNKLESQINEVELEN